jgi:hypothetical protein
MGILVTDQILPETSTIGSFSEHSDIKFPEFPGHASSPAHIRNWRFLQFCLAAENVLDQDTPLPPEFQDTLAIKVGCHEMANRASTFVSIEGLRVYSPHAQKLGKLIGSKVVKDLYATAPPSELVDFVISDENKQRWRYWMGGPQLHQITVETLHGRIEWEDRFEEAGAPTPSDYIARYPLGKPLIY